MCFHVSFTEVTSGPFGHKSALLHWRRPSGTFYQLCSGPARGIFGYHLQTHSASSAWLLPFVIQSSVLLDIQCMCSDLTSKTLFSCPLLSLAKVAFILIETFKHSLANTHTHTQTHVLHDSRHPTHICLLCKNIKPLNEKIMPHLWINVSKRMIGRKLLTHIFFSTIGQEAPNQLWTLEAPLADHTGSNPTIDHVHNNIKNNRRYETRILEKSLLNEFREHQTIE